MHPRSAAKDKRRCASWSRPKKDRMNSSPIRLRYAISPDIRARPALALGLFSQFVFAGVVSIPATRIIIQDAVFSDPKGNADAVGGNAYDRASDEIGVVKTLTNDAKSTVTPSKATPFVKFKSDTPGVATISSAQDSPSSQKVTITGVARGKALITPKTLPSRKLKAYVFSPFQRTVAFHIISDNAGHTAGLSVAQVQAIVAQANLRWGGQANITFGPNTPIDSVTVPIDLGSAVDLTNSPSAEEQAIINAAKSEAVAFNVYFVHKLDATAAGGGTPPGATRSATGDSFISITSLDINRTTAHELGHDLGLSAASGLSDYTDAARLYQLMYGIEGGGFTITPSQGDVINPAL